MTSWFNYLNSAALIGALLVGAFQIRRLALDARERDRDRQTERALELYRDLVVTGDTASAFHRLSVLLRHKGSARHRGTTWYLMDDGGFQEGGMLDPSQVGPNTPFEDIYRVLWYFERVEISLRFNLVRADVLFSSIGFHIWWWGQILRNIHEPKSVQGLRQLEPLVVEWAKKHGGL